MPLRILPHQLHVKDLSIRVFAKDGVEVVDCRVSVEGSWAEGGSRHGRGGRGGRGGGRDWLAAENPSEPSREPAVPWGLFRGDLVREKEICEKPLQDIQKL